MKRQWQTDVIDGRSEADEVFCFLISRPPILSWWSLITEEVNYSILKSLF